MIDRRDFLRTSAWGVGAASLAPWLQQALGAPVTSTPPQRFIFIHKGNGLLPESLVPPSFSPEDAEKEKHKHAFSVDLNSHDLPDWMAPVAEYKSRLTILQGLSGKMCTVGHHSWQSALGVYRANEALRSIKWATVDFELARMFPSPLEHIELACFPTEGGNARGNINGVEKGFSARGPQQPNYAFGSPKVALRELFKSVSSNQSEHRQYELERQLLEFTAGSQARLAAEVEGAERTKVANYVDSIDAIRSRNQNLEQMADVIRKHLPQLDAKYLADDITTVDRQVGHTEILLAALISGMTNVVTFTVDELGTYYTGLPGLESERVILHDVGHGKSYTVKSGTYSANEVRAKVRRQHMTLIGTIIKRLQQAPEGDGNMFDNTLIFYFADNGETHHSTGVEWPFLVFSGRNAKLDLAGKYIRLPHYGEEGHKTLGNWYTTLLNAYGQPIAHYGDFDLALEKMKRDQKGAIAQFLG